MEIAKLTGEAFQNNEWCPNHRKKANYHREPGRKERTSVEIEIYNTARKHIETTLWRSGGRLCQS